MLNKTDSSEIKVIILTVTIVLDLPTKDKIARLTILGVICYTVMEL